MGGNTSFVVRRFILRAALIGCAFLVLTASFAGAQQSAKPSATDNLILFFYKDPQPERLTGLLSAMQSQSLQWNAYPPVAGLLSVVFKRYPEWIDRLTPTQPDAKAATTVVAALRLAGQATKADALASRLGKDGLDATLSAQFAGLTQLDDLRIATPTHLDILWGASFADGDERRVQRIIDFFAEAANRSELMAIDISKITISMIGGPKEVMTTLKDKYGEADARRLILAGVALWGIRGNVQHAFVRDTVAHYLRDHPGTPAAKALSAAMSGIKPG